MLELQKIRKDINWLIEQIKCLMNKSDLTAPLTAIEWSTNHSLAEGNPYNKEAFTWYNGHVYKSLIDNNQYPPTNATYWTDLGEGHQLLEEQSDWNATTGRAFIRNKPLVSNVDQNNKVIYFYPTLAELGVLTLEEVTETQITNWIQNQGILIAEDEIPLFKIKLDLFAFTMYEVGVTGFLPSTPIMKTFYATSGTNNNGNILVDVGANVYLDNQGSFPFYPEDENLKYVYQWGSTTSQCYYKIDSNSKVTIRTCESIS